MKKHLCVALCSVLYLPACLDFYNAPELPPPLQEPSPWRNAEMLEFRFDGQVGDVRAGEDQYAVDATMSHSYLFIDLRAAGYGNAVMNQLSVHGIGSMEYGRTYRSTAPSDASVNATLVGCSGPREGEWDWDVYVEDVRVRIEEGQQEGTVELFFEAYSPGSLSTQGHVVIQH